MAEVPYGSRVTKLPNSIQPLFQASAVGRKSDVITNILAENYSSAKKGILGTIDLALKTLCVIAKPDAELIEVSVTAFERPFEVSTIFFFKFQN